MSVVRMKQEQPDVVAEKPAAARATTAPVPPPPAGPNRWQLAGQAFQHNVLPPLLGLTVFVLLWALVSVSSELPGPAKTFDSAVQVFSDPFYDRGPNDQGIGWNVLLSLARVGVGFGLAALVGIPLGFLIGYFGFLNRMLAPIISILRPVSPLAWLPIGLYVFKQAQPAAIWVIFISSLWPMVLNTASGVTQVPQDYLNVARVLKLSPWKMFSRILFPAVLPYMLTGVRLSIGVAWLVIAGADAADRHRCRAAGAFLHIGDHNVRRRIGVTRKVAVGAALQFRGA